MFNSGSPYTEMFVSDIKKQLMNKSNKKKVLHHKTCPRCSRKLVNLYLDPTTKIYICKMCFDNSVDM